MGFDFDTCKRNRREYSNIRGTLNCSYVSIHYVLYSFQFKSSSKGKDDVTNLLQQQETAVKSMLRLQDKELQEMVDQGMAY